MMTIYPLMSPKRKEQIESALTNWKSKKMTKSKGSLICGKGHRIEGNNILPYTTSGGNRSVICKECHNNNMKESRRKRQEKSHEQNSKAISSQLY